MTKFTNPLENIKIASPCSADWETMIGDARKRFCGDCRQNVYNLSGMSRSEAENLLIQSEGRVCVRYFRRTDGTVLTKDCPIGVAAIKKQLSRFWTAAVSLAFTFFAGIGITSYFANGISREDVMGTITVQQNQDVGEFAIPKIDQDVPPENVPMMGAVTPDYSEIEGKVSNIDEVKRRIIENQTR